MIIYFFLFFNKNNLISKNTIQKLIIINYLHPSHITLQLHTILRKYKKVELDKHITIFFSLKLNLS